MGIPSDYYEIVSILSQKTIANQVNWKGDKFTFYVVYDGARFSIWTGTDEDTEERFVAFGLSDEKGGQLDSWYVDESDGPDFSIMLSLFNSAKRYASGVPEKLRKLKDALASSNSIGFSDFDD